MNDRAGTNEELIKELEAARARIDELKWERNALLRNQTHPDESARESEITYRELVENAGEGIVVFHGFSTVFANQKACDIVGYTAEEMKSMNILDIIHPDDRQFIIQKREERFETNSGSITYESRVVGKTGQVRWVHTAVTTIEWEGEPATLSYITDITERKEMEQALRKSEEMLQTVVRASPVGIGIVKNRIIQWSNDRFFEITGYLREKLVDHDVSILYETHEEYERVGRVQTEQITERGTGSLQTQFKRKDGVIIDVVLSLTPLTARDPSDSLVFTVLDVTEQRETERALRESDARFRAYFENSPAGLVIFNTDDPPRYVEINQKLADMNGRPIDSHIGKTVAEVFEDTDIVKKNNRIIRRIIDTQKPKTIKSAGIMPTGKYIYYSAHYFPLQDTEGTVTGVGSVIYDITDIWRAEQALRESEARFRAFFENSPAGMLIWDNSDPAIYLEINQTLAEINGLPRDIHFGKTMDDLFDDKELVQANHEITQHILRTGEFVKVDSTGVMPSGRSLRYVGHYFPLPDADGNPQAVGAVIIDFTEGKRADEALQKQQQLAMTLSKTTELHEALDAILDAALSLEGPDSGGIYLADSDSDVLRLVCANGFSEAFRERVSDSRLLKDAANMIINGESVFCSFEDFGLTDEDAFVQEGLRGVGVLPVLYRGDIIGSLNVASHTNERFPSSTESFLRSVASYIGEVLVRLHTEERLRENEERLRTLIDAMPDIVCFKDGNGRWLEANAFSLDLFQLKDVDYHGKIDLELGETNPVYRDMFIGCAHTDEKAWEKGAPRRGEEIIPTPDGSSLVFDIIKVPTYYPDGRRKGLVVVGRDITTRKRAEEELSRSKSLLEAVIRQAPFAVHILDGSFNNIHCLIENSESIRIMGASIEGRDDIDASRSIGCQFFSLDDNTEVPLGDMPGPRAFGGETPFGEQYRFKHSDGTEILVEGGASPVFGDDGTILAVVVTFHDITERKQGEDELNRSKSLLEAVIRQAPFAVHILDGEFNDFCCLIENSESIRIMGASFEGVSGINASKSLETRFFRLTDGSEVPLSEMPSPRAFKGEIVLAEEYRFLHENGTEILVEAGASPVKNENGDVQAVVVTFHDITDRKRAEDELRKFKATIDRAPFGAAMTDLDGNLIYANTVWAQMHGYTVEELPGRHLSIFHNADQISVVEAINRDLVTHGSYAGEEVGHVTRDGRTIPTLMSATVITNDQGDPLYLSATALDITDRKQAEDALRLEQELGIALSKTTDLQEALDLILDTALAIEGPDTGVIFLNDPATGQFYLAARQGVSDDFIESASRLRDIPAGNTMMHREEPYFTTFTSQEPDDDDAHYTEGLKARGILPVKSGENIIGTLNVASHTDTEFSPVVQGYLVSLASHIGEVIVRLRAEEHHRESEKRYRALVENNADVIMRFDNEYRHLFINSAFDRYSDIPGQTLIGRTHREIGFPEDICDEWENGLGHVFQTGKPHEGEFSWTNERGTTLFNWRAFPELDHEGKVRTVLTIARDITKTRQTEQNYRTLFNNSSDAIFLHDLQGRFIDVNDVACDQVDYARDELLTKGIADIIATEDISRIQPTFQTLLDHGSVVFEAQHVRRDGSHVPVEISSRLIEYMGTPAILSAVRDITERKEVEKERERLIAEVQKSEKNYRDLFNGASDSILIHDSQGRVLDVNSVACKQLGYTRDEFLKLTLKDIINPKNAVHIMERIKKIHERGELIFESEWVARDGRHIPVEVNARIIDYRGTPAVFSTARDITERKEAEKERDRLITAIEQASENIVVFDRDGRIRYVNPSYLNLTGYSRDEVIGQTVHHLEHKTPERFEISELATAVSEGRTWNGHAGRSRKDGTEYQVVSTFTPVRNPDGTITNYVLVERDVTHEAELEKRLRQAQKMEAIGTLAGGIAHDFNNILSAIVGYNELAMISATPTSSIYSMLEQIERASQRATDLVGQILTFSRQTEQERKPTQIQFVLKEAYKLLRASLPATIEMRQRIDNDCPPVMADATQIHQVIMNLCTNAYHAMQKTGGSLTVSLEETHITDLEDPELDVGSYVHLRVSDTGTGIPPEIQTRIFEPYFTTKEKGEGTGLGLATVHGIVKGHGGSITVESVPDEGTVFNVLLPTCLAETPETTAAPVSSSFAGEQAQLLVVDDEEAITNMWKIALEDLGYIVTVCGHATAALELLRNDPEKYDLILSDQTMPGMTGTALAEEVRKDHPDLPFILCTGFAERVDLAKVEQLHIAHLLTKPISLLELTQAVRETLG